MSTYDTPIRDRKAARTRGAILEALAEEIAAEGVCDAAIERVAARAGVSHRTVYRHFVDRRALLDALAEHVREVLSAEVDEASLRDADDLVDVVPFMFGRFDELGAPVAAMARLSVLESIRSEAHAERTGLMAELLAPRLDGLDDPVAVFAVLRHLVSAVGWGLLREASGLEGERLGHAVGSVIEAVLDAADRTGGHD